MEKMLNKDEKRQKFSQETVMVISVVMDKIYVAKRCLVLNTF